jgi:hypothetical protein
MVTVKEVLQDKITLDIECVDRVLLNGYVKYLQMPGGLVNFIREQKQMPIPSPKAMYEMTQTYRSAVEAFAAAEGLEIYEFKKKDVKEEIAQARLAQFSQKSGVVLIGKAQEKASAFKGKRADKENGKVWFNYSRQEVYVTHYYFYILDEEFGLGFIKVCTYLPFEVKVCFNGHERAKQCLRQEGLAFEALDNGFAACAQPHRLQQVCHELSAEKIQAYFDRWVDKLPWPLSATERAAGYGHQLSIWQLEVSRTQIFIDPAQGRALVESIIRDNLDLGRPDQVSLLFERRVTQATPSEFHSRVIQHGVLPSIRVKYKHSALKQYFKDGRGLRSEMMFNNLADFGFNKGLVNFAAVVDFGRHCLKRLLEQLQVSQDCFLPLDQVRQLGQPTHLDNGQRASALRFGDPRVMALMAALARHGHLLTDMTNPTLRETVAQFLGDEAATYSSAHMSYDLRRLRLKGLIERLPNSYAYRLTDLGTKTAIFFTKLQQRLFNPGLSALLPDPLYPSPLAQALTTVADQIQALIEAACLTSAQATA